MKFPDSSNKGLQYEACAYMLADTLGYMGYDLTKTTVQRWGSMMYRLAAADELTESYPVIIDSGAALVECLDIEPNKMAVGAAEGLLNASKGSIDAPTITEHLDNRRDEATESALLLRSQTPELIEDGCLWGKVRYGNCWDLS